MCFVHACLPPAGPQCSSWMPSAMLHSPSCSLIKEKYNYTSRMLISKRLLAKSQPLHYSALQRPTMNTRDPKYYLFFQREQEDPLVNRKFCLPKQVRVSSEVLSFSLAGRSFFPCKICCLKLFRDLTWPSLPSLLRELLRNRLEAPAKGTAT